MDVRQHIKGLLGDKDELVDTFLEMIQKEIPSEIETIEAALQTGDFNQAYESAHSVKNYVGYLPDKELFGRIAKFEQQIHQNQTIEALKIRFEKIKQEISEIMRLI